MQKLIGSALLGALLVGCGTSPSTPTPGTPNPGTPTYSVSGQVLLPGAGAASLTGAELEALWALPHVPGEVLVRDADAGTGGLGAQGLSVLSGLTLQAVPGTDLSRAATPAGEGDEAFAQRLAAAGLDVQPNLIYRPLAVPNDPGFPAGPGLAVPGRPYLYDQDYLTRIRALEGWNRLEALGKRKSGVLTAVLDTGVDRSHPELSGRLRQGRDFCSRLVGDACQGTDDDPAEVTAGDVGHGTSSAGIIAANTNNGQGIAALTWGGTVLPVKVFGTDGRISGATSASLTAGLNYAVRQGARVINLSLGFAGKDGRPAPADPTIAQALANAAARDVIVVAAAGNRPNEEVLDQAPNTGIFYPASDPNVLAVGALGREDSLACYSARPVAGQKALDLVAPGGNAGTGGPNCYVTSDYDILTLTTVGLGRYTLRAGTSEAAPQVSGAASLLRGAFPSLTAAQVRQALTAGARSAGGQRILNVEGAIAQAERLTATPPANRNYSLLVEARRGGSVVTSKTFTGTLPQGQRAINYSLNGLAAGTYTLNARVTLTNPNETVTGTRNVQISGNLSGVNIQTQR
ncbi:S8 family serine peptidase [Deinococcus sp. SDU3-2]|uniref:S8 family serine peptidase n=1 Tax=Deinococcus terrestris TaxID=2651870 RepID=A0A7X1NV67_9DEIO|nr:S8 family serine peptidase [Deinococcus terrestris]MPY66427.1 S8 family serine peptidase [Deinococcus terrestris]